MLGKKALEFFSIVNVANDFMKEMIPAKTYPYGEKNKKKNNSLKKRKKRKEINKRRKQSRR